MAVGAGVHHGFELGAGAGLMLQRELGLRGAAATWSLALPAIAFVGWRGPPRWARLVAAATGANLAAVIVHYTLWPFRLWPWRRFGLPVLTSAEGLADGHLGVYNAILLGWGTASATALAVSQAGARRWAVLGFVSALPLRRDARQHFAWIHEQAVVNPAWWNRALGPSGEVRS